MTKESAEGFTIECKDGATTLEFSGGFIQELCEGAFGPGNFFNK